MGCGGASGYLHHKGLLPQARTSTAPVAVQGRFLNFSQTTCEAHAQMLMEFPALLSLCEGGWKRGQGIS